MRYSLLAGGKRIRPVLALATAEALERDPDEVLPLAGALEMIHTYSLIHDDLPAMDDDELRRGQPTCHVAYGEDVAILAGDGLFAEAAAARARRAAGRAGARAGRGPRARGRGEVVSGMVGGQYLDVAGDRATSTRRPPPSARAQDRRADRRLGRVSDPGCWRADEPATIAFRRFAAELGVLFQIVDDILDVTGDEAALGKPQGSDERHGKSDLRERFRTGAGPRAGSRIPPEGAGSAGRGRRRHRHARADRRLHPHPRHMSLLDQIDGPHGPPRPERRPAPAGRPGGPRADHRHDRRDRRPLRRQPRRLRDRGGPPLACSTRRATRSSGTSATRPTRTRSSPAAATSSTRSAQYGGLAPFCSIAESEHDIMGAGHASTSVSYAVGIKEAMRRGHRRGRQAWWP